MSSLSKPTNSTNRVSERSLRNKLRKKVYGIVIVLVASAISLFFFAPQIGSFFGIFSKYRNDPGYVPRPKPMPPTFVDAPEATNKDTISLTGKALTGAEVKIYVNGPERGKTTTGADGVFNFYDISLNSGTNTIFAKAFDDYGNESDSSEFLIIKLDKTPPEIDVDSPKDGDTVKNLNSRIEISGKINEKATISINGLPVIQRSDLSFSYVLGVKEGNIEIKIEVIDLAGNRTEKEMIVRYVKSS